MVLPGTLPLSIIRGIAFDEVKLLCRDSKVTVSGTLVPDATGLYIPSGEYGGHEMFILPGTLTYFLYYNAAAASYVLATVLTTGALTHFWVPAVALVDEPTGTYLPQGSFTGTATITDHPTDLTGFTVEAHVKRNTSTDITLDLNPSITDDVNGEITLPAISSDDTQDYDFVGTFRWDLVLVNGSGERFGPYIKGPFVVTDNETQPT